MAEFRKWLFAFAVVALLSSLAVPVSAQVPTQQNVSCTASSGGNPPLVRAEGLAELVGDVVLVCQGGTPTPAGAPVPLVNFNIFLTTNVTSKLVSGDLSEAMLIIDEPHSPSNPAVPLLPCDGGVAPCSLTGTGTGAGTYSGAEGRVNVFQGRMSTFNPNQVSFNGVPFDPPGTQGTRTVRITNIRGNANQLGVSSTLIPSQITEFISISGVSFITVNNPQATVAFIQPGLRTSVSGGVSFPQCISRNAGAAGGGGSFDVGPNIVATYREGFASAWKVRNVAQVTLKDSAGNIIFQGNPLTTADGDVNQDIVGIAYNTESGFFAGTANELTAFGVGPTANVPFPSDHGMNASGRASQGTRLFANFNATAGTSSIPAGSSAFIPVTAPLYDPADGTVTGFAVLISTDANGAGGSIGNVGAGTVTESAADIGAALGGKAGAAWTTFGGNIGFVAIGTGTAVYEVVQTDPSRLEAIALPVNVAFVANPGNNLPAGSPAKATASLGFAPQSNVGTASASAPVPRFAPSGTPSDLFSIQLCSCNILFPFVSNQQGFDTGVAISNTSLDPYGTTPQQGKVTLFYYGPGTPPPSQVTNAAVPAGQQLLFTLSGGGNFGIAAVPGFQGYIIAQSNFSYCHGFAYISAQGALPTAPGASEGYLGIVLDSPFRDMLGGNYVNRTGQFGEVQAH